jgi:DNA-binding response OmpR family regulator
LKKIFIVDDEENTRRMIRLSLEGEGYEFCEAEDGDVALGMALKLKPDLVILDVMMPSKWGYAVCDELKQEPETRHIPVLFLTARKSGISRRMGQIKGGDAYLTKPFHPQDLRVAVRKLLGLVDQTGPGSVPENPHPVKDGHGA